MHTPALIFPWHLGGALQSDEEFALEIEEFVEVWEEKVYSVLINRVTLREILGVSLL